MTPGAERSNAAPDRGAGRLWRRVPLLAGGAIALVLGIAGGLQRLGWSVADGASLAELHGPLMVCGFFGTVIALERAVALRRGWAFLGPLAAMIATVAAAAGLPIVLAQAGWMVAGLALLAASGWIAIRHRAHFTVLLALAAAGWPMGVAAWLLDAGTGPMVLWWLTFLVLTIAAERLELNRVLRPTAFSRRIFWVPVATLPLAALVAAVDEADAWRLAGAALLGLAAWLARNDVARRTIRAAGLPRYAAVCLLSGYAWLAAGGLVMLVLPLAADRLAYDAALHAVFLGFVFAMVFGHAPIILPAVTGLPVGFSTLLYGPLALLHLSVAMRVAGDLLPAWDLRSWSGAATAAAIAWFVASIVGLVLRGRGPRPRRVCAPTKTGGTADANVAR